MLASQYLLQTQQLLQNPMAAAGLYAISDLQGYINSARTFLAGESECVRVSGTYAAPTNTVSFPFSSISYSGSGYAEVLNVRQMQASVVGGGYQPMYPRSFPWFMQYNLNPTTPPTGIPKEWAQQGQGASGTLYISPLPSVPTTLYCDLAMLPAAVIADTDPDVIPDIYSGAAPYYAAYLAYLSAQRTADADAMFKRYREFLSSARGFANGYLLPSTRANAPDPVNQSRFSKPSGGQ